MGKIWVLVFGLFSAVCAYGQYDSIPFDGYERTYLLHTPPSYNGVDALPLIIAMHGGFGNGYNMENQSLLSEKADSENFIVVYPEGVKSFINIRTWNAGGCCGFASNFNVDDVGFINALLDTLLVHYAIDESRIYATGMSNGGFMSYRLACELSDRIAAIAPVASTMTLEECEPLRPVPVIHFHSYLDSNVPYEGGQGNGFSSHYNPPLDSVMNVWAVKDGCAIANEVVVDNDQYTFTRSSDCECLSEVHLYITTDGGHSWPGGTFLLGDPVSEFINANDLMWDFFENHSLECNVTAVETPLEKREFAIFPNPSTGMFYFDLGGDSKFVNVEIYDVNGRLIREVLSSGIIDLTDQLPGFYSLRMVDSTQFYFVKALIVK